METGKIYGSLAAIMNEVQAIGKNKKNTQQGFSYRGIDDVMNELHGLFAKNGVVIVPQVLEVSKTDKQSAQGRALFYVMVKMSYRFICTDGSAVESVVAGEAMDSGDKAVNKAVSVALKYCLLQMFLIPTEDMKDPDGACYEVKSAPAPAPAAAPPAVEASVSSATHAIDLEVAVSDAAHADTKGALKAIWDAYPHLHKEERFVTALSERKKALGG